MSSAVLISNFSSSVTFTMELINYANVSWHVLTGCMYCILTWWHSQVNNFPVLLIFLLSFFNPHSVATFMNLTIKSYFTSCSHPKHLASVRQIVSVFTKCHGGAQGRRDNPGSGFQTSRDLYFKLNVTTKRDQEESGMALRIKEG